MAKLISNYTIQAFKPGGKYYTHESLAIVQDLEDCLSLASVTNKGEDAKFINMPVLTRDQLDSVLNGRFKDMVLIVSHEQGVPHMYLPESMANHE